MKLVLITQLVWSPQRVLPQTLPENITQKLCADFQDVAFEHVEDRLRRALDFVDYKHIPVTALVVVGGVAANQELRR